MRKRGCALPAAIGIAAAAVIFGLGACSSDKLTEQFQDAPISQRDTTGAEIINMPDGYANIATKCYRDSGIRVFSATVGDVQANGGAARAITAVPDPTCPKSQ